MPSLLDLQTPSLILDKQIVEHNIRKLVEHTANLNVELRPHLKTPKSIHIAKILVGHGANKFCVSTLNEAEYFIEQMQYTGMFSEPDLFYTVPITLDKINRVLELQNKGAKLYVQVDDAAALEQIMSGLQATFSNSSINVILELDIDGYRTGLEKEALISLAQRVVSNPYTHFAGIMSYAGHSYDLSISQTAELTDVHLRALQDLVEALKTKNIECEVVSLGSTPAIKHAKDLTGLTEARCGIYTLEDLMQAGIHACSEKDIALSVLATVVAVYPQHNRLVIDAGGLALSKDRSTQGRSFDCKYGWVCDVYNHRVGDLWVYDVSQEIGMVQSASNKAIESFNLTVGSKVRILPNHADMTAAAYEEYHVINNGIEIIDKWTRTNRWG